MLEMLLCRKGIEVSMLFVLVVGRDKRRRRELETEQAGELCLIVIDCFAELILAIVQASSLIVIDPVR